jgi:predicted dehydrogenase
VNHVRSLVSDGYVGRVLSTTLVASDDFSSGTVAEANAYTLDAANGANPLTIHAAHFIDTLVHVVGDLEDLTTRVSTSRARVHVRESGQEVVATAPDQIAVAAKLQRAGVASIHIRAGRSPTPNLL